MKKIIIPFILSIILFSCEKEKSDSYDIPAWLKLRIAEDESKIAADPRSGLDIAAWIRYEYRDLYYYEYHNMLSSSGPKVYNSIGDLVNFVENSYMDYLSGKCCKKYIWKGSAYFGD
jgi:hypothetical protein